MIQSLADRTPRSCGRFANYPDHNAVMLSRISGLRAFMVARIPDQNTVLVAARNVRIPFGCSECSERLY